MIPRPRAGLAETGRGSQNQEMALPDASIEAPAEEVVLEDATAALSAPAADPMSDRAETRVPGTMRLLAWTVGVSIVGLGLVLVFRVVEPNTMTTGITNAWGWLQAAPAPVYFGVFALVALAPFPCSILYVTAGPLFGVTTSLLWIAPALALNTVMVHALASGVLRPRLESVLTKRGLRVPRIEHRNDRLLFAVLIRLTPGVPFFVQSWLIALSGLALVPFILITVAIQMLYATGFVVLGRSAFEGEVGGAAIAISALVVVSIGARLLHKHLRRKRAALAADEPMP